MKLNFFLVFILLVTGCKQQTISKVLQAYPDGSTKVEVILSPDEKIKYEQISYFDDGKVAIRGKFKNNKRHGPWKSFFMDGSIKSVNNYKNGEYDGKYLVYDKEGNIILEGEYKNGKKTGQWYSYNKAGEKIDYKKFDDQGNLIK